MVLVPYAGKYFGRKCAYWCEFLSPALLLFLAKTDVGGGEKDDTGEKDRNGWGVVEGNVDVADVLEQSYRLGAIYAVEIPGRDRLHEQEDLQGRRGR